MKSVKEPENFRPDKSICLLTCLKLDNRNSGRIAGASNKGLHCGCSTKQGNEETDPLIHQSRTETDLSA